MSKKYVAYAGTYTHGYSRGIHIYDVDVEAGSLTERKTVPVSNPSHIRRSYNREYLYSITDDGVAVFKILKDGDLEMINKVGIDGMRGCYLTVDAEGKYLVVAGYHDGKVTLIQTREDGSLGPILDGIFHEGIGSVAERNFTPHVSCVKFTPDNKYLCAVDNGIDQIKIYQITKTNKLRLLDILRLKRESGPWRMRFSNDGRFAYVIYQLDNCVDVFTYEDTENGPVFEKIQTVMTPSDNVDELHDVSAGISMTADGAHLFTSTAGDDTVAMFSVDKETGLLTKEFSLPISGEYPKDIALFPDGKHIACANHESDSITTFAIDYEKKVMTMRGKPAKLDAPNCIIITEMGFSKN